MTVRRLYDDLGEDPGTRPRPSRAVLTRDRVRLARSGDAPRIAVMASELALLTTGRPGLLSAAAVRRDLIGNPDLHCRVADRAGEAIGYVLWSAAYDSAYAARGVYLSDLYVMESHRRMGVARTLMAEVARCCEADGGRFIWWVVTPGNAAAEHFYDGLGATTDRVNARAVFEAPFKVLVGA